MCVTYTSPSPCVGGLVRGTWSMTHTHTHTHTTHTHDPPPPCTGEHVLKAWSKQRTHRTPGPYRNGVTLKQLLVADSGFDVMVGFERTTYMLGLRLDQLPLGRLLAVAVAAGYVCPAGSEGALLAAARTRWPPERSPEDWAKHCVAEALIRAGLGAEEGAGEAGERFKMMLTRAGR